MEEDFIRTKSMHISKNFIDFKVEINRITQNENSQEYKYHNTRIIPAKDMSKSYG
jgi:hypothetical protein